eukprot:symbB.v1.2.002629.t1/scaffold139.1/size300179/12
MGALCSCEEGEDAAPDQQEEEVKDLSEDFAAKKATLEDQKRISDDRAKRMDENWKQTQAIMRHVHRMPPLRTQHFVQASAPSVAVNQMYPRVVSGYAPAVPLQRPLAAPAPRMLRSGPQLPRMLRVGPVAVQVMEEPSMQSKRLPWVVQEPGQVVLTSGATHGEWVQLLFAHSRKGWAPLRSFMSEPRGGMHGDGMYDGLDRAICSHQSVPTDCGSSEESPVMFGGLPLASPTSNTTAKHPASPESLSSDQATTPLSEAETKMNGATEVHQSKAEAQNSIEVEAKEASKVLKEAQEHEEALARDKAAAVKEHEEALARDKVAALNEKLEKDQDYFTFWSDCESHSEWGYQSGSLSKAEQWVLAKYSSAPDVLLLEDVNSAPRIWNHKAEDFMLRTAFLSIGTALPSYMELGHAA